MQQATITLTPKADRGDVQGFQGTPIMPIEHEKQVTITVDGADDDASGYLFFVVLAIAAGAAALSGCETKTVVNNTGSGTVNVTGGTTTVSPNTSVGVGGGAPKMN